MPVAPLAAIGTIVFCLMNFMKALTSKNFSAAITQVIAWLSGVIAVTLAAHTDYASGVTFGDLSLEKLNGPSHVFLGLIASSILGTVHELKRAIDNRDSAVQPPLIPPLAKEEEHVNS